MTDTPVAGDRICQPTALESVLISVQYGLIMRYLTGPDRSGLKGACKRFYEGIYLCKHLMTVLVDR